MLITMLLALTLRIYTALTVALLVQTVARVFATNPIQNLAVSFAMSLGLTQRIPLLMLHPCQILTLLVCMLIIRDLFMRFVEVPADTLTAVLGLKHGCRYAML